MNSEGYEERPGRIGRHYPSAEKTEYWAKKIGVRSCPHPGNVAEKNDCQSNLGLEKGKGDQTSHPAHGFKKKGSCRGSYEKKEIKGEQT